MSAPATRSPSALARRLERNRQAELLAAANAHWPDVGYRSIAGGDARQMVVNGRECLMFASNDYMGLRWDPRVIAAGHHALDRYGVGASSSRLVAGSVSLHATFEEELADWLGREAALVFTTGYQANVGVLSALLGRHDLAVCDRGVHASLLDGCRLAGSRVRRFDRADLSTLEGRLAARPAGTEACVIADGVYSMDGDTLALDDVVAVVERHDGVCVLVDEAHALGVVGSEGAGVAGSSPLGSRVDVVTGNLSKALSSCGGYVAGSAAMVAAFRATCRSLIFSSASAPSSIAAALSAMRIVRAEPERRRHAHAVAARLRAGLAGLGLSTGSSDSLIVPALVGDDLAVISMTQRLMELGICVGSAVHPAVARNGAILRFSVTAALTAADADRAVEAVAQVLAEHGWPGHVSAADGGGS